MKKLALFGNTNFTKLIKYYIENDTHRNVECVVVDSQYIQEDTFENVPIVSFEKFVGGGYTPDEYEVLVCIGYSRMNTIRQEIYNRLKEYKYNIASYIHSSVSIPSNVIIGEGNIIFEDVTIQAFSKIGNSNLIWAKASVAHDCLIGDFNTIASSSSMNGFVEIKSNCFLGSNSTIRDHVLVDDFTLIGAGAYISKNTDKNSVYVPEKAIKLNCESMMIRL